MYHALSPRRAAYKSISAVTPRPVYPQPKWPPPVPPSPVNESVSIQSGDLKLVLASAQWNDYVVSVDGHAMAIGHTRPLIGLVEGGQPKWIEINRDVSAGR